ncbi:DUF433 domain-containing protein [Micromonospora sp. NBC_01813]|uniref:DUF433 domain-containing protein n=1 Tax=Micromonospora sp. NBC_01813 TaxID=2975988 RepID=UPI003FA39172
MPHCPAPKPQNHLRHVTLGQGYSVSEVIEEYPTLTKEDILAGLRFAARAVDERELPLRLSA